jgi:curli production assembly/transport component CsgF
MKKLLFLILLCFPLYVFSQQLVYKPINPAFGGETFNYQWMLSSATAQNGFTDPSQDADTDTSTLQSFTDNLNRQLLNRISSELFSQQFGDDELQPGTFTFGSLEVEISDGVTGLIINILDTTTGEQTQIIVPN